MSDWRFIPGWEGYYEVSRTGDIRSVTRTIPHGRDALKTLVGVILVPDVAPKSGHLSVSLYRHGQRTHIGVQQAVLLAFVGPCPSGMEACHKNGTPSDNRVENLYWGTRSDNMQDAVSHGSHHLASRTACKNEHEFTPENTFRRSSGARGCRTCNRKWKSEYKARKRSA